MTEPITTKYEIKNFEYWHYPTIKNWANKRRFNLPPIEQLPPTGLIGFIDAAPIAACFLSKTDSYSAILVGLITDPDFLDGKERKMLGDILMKRLVNAAKEAGLSIFCWTFIDKMKSRLTDIGFKKTEENATFYGI